MAHGGQSGEGGDIRCGRHPYTVCGDHLARVLTTRHLSPGSAPGRPEFLSPGVDLSPLGWRRAEGWGLICQKRPGSVE